MKRRTFLQSLAAAGLTLSGGMHATAAVKPRVGRRKRGGTKKLVVLFQRGGNDGLNTLIPLEAGESALYESLRPTLRIPKANVLSLQGQSFFGLHPAMASLMPIYNSGNLSFVHAVGYPNPDRSHFESQAYMETGVPGMGLLHGWLNRYLQHTSGSGLIRGISVGYNMQQSVFGTIPVPVSTNFGTLTIEVDTNIYNEPINDIRDEVAKLFELSATQGNANIYNTGNNIFQMINSFADRNLDDYAPENGAAYPDTNLGGRVKHAAQMLKDSPSYLGIEVVVLDQQGYDTHAQQLSPDNPVNPATGQAELLADLSQCMSAFYTDMGPTRMDDIMFLVVSEFGRRAYQNDSNGTDHGTGGLAMVMGNGVNGSIVNGGVGWPGLANLYEGDDLMWVTDYRDIYWEILANHMGVGNAALAQILPSHGYSPVGIINT